MNFKKISIFVLIFVLVIGFLTARVLASEAEVKWTFANPHPMEHPWGKYGQVLADLVKERSKGRFVINYYPGGVLGSENDTFDQTVAGAVNMMASGPSSMMNFYPPISILAAYYLFRDADHMDAALKTPVMQKLLEESRKASGVRTLNIWYYGTRQLTANFPVHTPEDLHNKRIRATGDTVAHDMLRAIGAVATPVNFNELYVALQTNLVDGQENPLPTIKAQKFYEVQDYLILTNHLVHAGNIIVNEEAFQALPSDLREILVEASDEVAVKVEKTIREEEEDLLEFFAKHMTIIRPDVDAFREKVRSQILEKYEDVWGKGLYEEIQAIQ